MKKITTLLICILLCIITILNLDKISDYIINYLDSNKITTIDKPNEYYKNYNYEFVKESETYTPYSYQGLLNIIYSVLNNGWDTFTFYCPDEYTECTNDLEKISNDETLLSNINTFVHPYNGFSNIHFVTKETGEITINVTKLYSKEDIIRINTMVDEIITQNITLDMTDEDKILTIHDYIIDNTKYDVNKENSSSYTALGPLFNRTAVCSGYADLMAIFLTKFNLNNYKVASDTHIWNAVYINGKWLHLDLTWDDPVTVNSNIDTLQHEFFLINTDKLHEFDIKDHIFDTTIYQELN